MNPKLSIIVPIYNVEQYVERCIESCLEQNISKYDYEIVCVNDGSTDKSLQIIEHLAKENTNIRVVSQSNGGLSAARNTGMDIATGEYWMFVDSDDWIEKNCLFNILAKLNQESPDILCICYCRSDGTTVFEKTSFHPEESLPGPQALARGLNPGAPFSIVKASFMKKFGFKFYKGIYHEDSELTPRMHYFARKVSFIDGVVYYYFTNPNSIMGAPKPKRSYDILNVVCPHLSDFSKSIPSCDQYIFDNIISMYLNNALNYICKCDDISQKDWSICLYKQRGLLAHLSKSTVAKYNIEGMLFKMFPKHILPIYKLLNKLV